MAQYLRRRSDGMLFGFSPDMAQNSELEVVDLEPGEAASSQKSGDPLTEEQLMIKQLGLTGDALAGYPDKGFATNPLAPYGTNPPPMADLEVGKFGKKAQQLAVAEKIRNKDDIRKAARATKPEPTEAQQQTIGQVGEPKAALTSNPPVAGEAFDALFDDPELEFGNAGVPGAQDPETVNEAKAQAEQQAQQGGRQSLQGPRSGQFTQRSESSDTSLGAGFDFEGPQGEEPVASKGKRGK